jgi:CRP-like cAMP-binding protein
VVVHEGDPGDRLFVIASGEVRACRDYSKVTEVELARLGPGECFGEMCILDTLPRSATIQTTNDSTLYALEAAAFYELQRAQPAQFSLLVLNMARDLSHRLRRLDAAFAAWQ